MEFLLLLASYGFCFGLMNDKAPFIGPLLRNLPLFPDEEGRTLFTRMLTCPYCTGFHTGYITWALWRAPRILDGLHYSMLIEALVFAFASSAACYILDVAAEWFERSSSK